METGVFSHTSKTACSHIQTKSLAKEFASSFCEKIRKIHEMFPAFGFSTKSCLSDPANTFLLKGCIDNPQTSKLFPQGKPFS